MESQKDFRVKVEYLSSGGPSFHIEKVRATTKYHAIELAFTKLHTLQPNRAMYEIYTKKRSMKQLAMQRCSHTLAGYAVCYAMTYS
jgi:hypothetical protein